MTIYPACLTFRMGSLTAYSSTPFACGVSPLQWRELQARLVVRVGLWSEHGSCVSSH